MFVTRYKNAVLARTLRPVALGAAILCFGVTSGLTGVSPAIAAESSLPQTLPNGSSNLTEIWMRSGGARLYWNTLTQPRQIRMVGAAFADPAAVPELMPSPQGLPEAKSSGKGSRGGKTAPHSVVVDPRAPVRSGTHASSRPAKQSGATAAQADKKSEAAQAAKAQTEKPASVSPALTAPASAPASARQGNGAAAATSSSAPSKNGTNGAVPTNGGKAREGAAYPPSSPSLGIGDGVAAPAGGAMPSGASSAPASTSASSSASTSSMSVTGTGAAAGAFGKAGAGSVRSSNGGVQPDVPAPPPIPSLSADDLLPPSNGGNGSSGGGGAPVRAPLP